MASEYTDLLAEIKTYLGRNDMDAMIPHLVALAEARMNRELRLKLMEREAFALTVPGQNSLPLPDKRVPGDWDVFLEMRDLRLNGALLQNMDFVSLDTIPEQKETGTPYAYSIRGRELVLVPEPDKAYELRMVYYAEVPPLGDAQPANDVLLRAPDLYLYGALTASVPYARNSAPLELWAGAYELAKNALMNSDTHGRFTANINMRPVRNI